jgi:molybdopterin-synthase adenylyltransferase
VKIIAKRMITNRSRRESYTDRQERVEGWRQDRMKQGRILVNGAGALGNEVVKNLALMGIGYMLIADMDKVDRSNLSRAALLRRSDIQKQRNKAEAVAERAKSMKVNSETHIQPFVGDIVWRLGTGVYRRVDAILGCLDNVEARLSTNKNCLLTGKPYIDGAIHGLSGHVASINPPMTPCWECSVHPSMLQYGNERYDSCWNVMNQDFKAGVIPTVQVAASIVAGFQTQEAVKVVQDLPWAAGTKTTYSAIGARPQLDNVILTKREECWCNLITAYPQPLELSLSAYKNTLGDLHLELRKTGAKNLIVQFPDKFVIECQCHACGQRRSILQPAFTLSTADVVCFSCGAMGDSVELHSVTDDRPEGISDIWPIITGMSLYDLGFAPLGWVEYFPDTNSNLPFYAELSADAIAVMGSEAFISIRPHFDDQ